MKSEENESLYTTRIKKYFKIIHDKTKENVFLKELNNFFGKVNFAALFEIKIVSRYVKYLKLCHNLCLFG